MTPRVHRAADASSFKPEGHEGVSPVRLTGTIPVYQWETRTQRLIVDVEHATLGTIALPGMALRTFDMSPAGRSESTRLEHAAPPQLDADGPAIRKWLE